MRTNDENNIMKRTSVFTDQSGGVLVLVALLLVVIFGVAAFAIDIGHLTLVRNEIQNAADAGALAGARMLYSSATNTTLTINTGANFVASTAAAANSSDGSAVEVLTVERGHWSMTSKTFTANSAGSYSVTSLDFTTLDTDPNFINAVRVVTGRGPTVQAASFFASIFGPRFAGFSLSAEAVAWRSFAGNDLHFDEPIGICKQAIMNNGVPDCTVGKMINDTSDTGSWTDLTQGSCNASSVSEVRPLICPSGGSNFDKVLNYGDYMDVINGQAQTLFSYMRPCWLSAALFNWPADNNPAYRTWNIKLPVVDCGPGASPNCKKLLGIIEVEVFWITQNGNDSKFTDIPPRFDVNPDVPGLEYVCPQSALNDKKDPTGRMQCWLDLLNQFGVKDANGNGLTIQTAAALHTPSTLFFKPSCKLSEAAGAPPGPPFGPLSQNPRLVK